MLVLRHAQKERVLAHAHASRSDADVALSLAGVLHCESLKLRAKCDHLVCQPEHPVEVKCPGVHYDRPRRLARPACLVDDPVRHTVLGQPEREKQPCRARTSY